MNAGNTAMTPQPPTPDDAESVLFFIRWWQEFLGGVILGFTGLYFRSKGRSSESAIIPMSEEEIDHRMTICKQSVLLAINERMRDHDEKQDAKLDRRDERFLEKIEKLHIRLNKEAGVE